jgi:hypothetical protein
MVVGGAAMNGREPHARLARAIEQTIQDWYLTETGFDVERLTPDQGERSAVLMFLGKTERINVTVAIADR